MARYDAYLLRIWRGAPGEASRWAGRLEHLPDGGYRRFGSLEELLDYLGCLLAEEAGACIVKTEGKQEQCSDH